MTKILIDRSTVEQALEALELMVVDVKTTPTAYEAQRQAIAAIRAALAEPQRRKTGKPRNATTRLGVVCFEAYARSYVGSNRWDIAAEAVRRAALAEPVQQGCDHCNHPLYAAIKCKVCGRVTEPVQEPKPVAWLYRGNLHPFDPSDGASDPATPLYTAPPQRPAEPVAFSVGRTLHWHDGKGVNDAQLYLAPPQCKPLSEDEIFKIENDIPDDVIGDRAWTICFARAIERAHGIGGEQ